MRISDILVGILENPFSPRYYKEMMVYYKEKGMTHEAEALQYLLKQKFHEKTDDSHSHEER